MSLFIILLEYRKSYLTQGKSMLNNKNLHSLIPQIITLIIISTGIVTTTQAKTQQQTIFLDAAGNPIPNDILLSLSTNTKRPNKHQKVDKLEKGSQKKLKPQKKYQDNPELEKELLQAMKAGKVTRVDQLLRAHIRPTYKNYKGETPLGIAVSRGWASMVIKLLENGANINEKGPQGINLLHIASSRGMTDVAKVLVKKGLNPNKKTDKNWTPLHIAARYGHWQLVQYFIQLGVDPDIRNSDGKTALGLARHLRHMGVIKMLSQVTTVRSLEFKKKKRRKRKSKKRRN